MFVLIEYPSGDEYFYCSYADAYAAMKCEYEYARDYDSTVDLIDGVDHILLEHKARVLDRSWEIFRDEGC